MAWEDYGINGHLLNNTPIKENHKLGLIYALNERASVIPSTGSDTYFTPYKTKYINQKAITKDFRDWIINSIVEMMTWYKMPLDDWWTAAVLPGETGYSGSVDPPEYGYYSDVVRANWFNTIYDIINEMQYIIPRTSFSYDPPYHYERSQIQTDAFTNELLGRNNESDPWITYIPFNKHDTDYYFQQDFLGEYAAISDQSYIECNVFNTMYLDPPYYRKGSYTQLRINRLGYKIFLKNPILEYEINHRVVYLPDEWTVYTPYTTIIPGGSTNTLSTGSNNWTKSTHGSNEYYYTSSSQTPSAILEDSSYLLQSTLGNLSSGSWAYGDNDTIGENRIYVRLSDSTDPDTKPSGFMEYIFAFERTLEILDFFNELRSEYNAQADIIQTDYAGGGGYWNFSPNTNNYYHYLNYIKPIFEFHAPEEEP